MFLLLSLIMPKTYRDLHTPLYIPLSTKKSQIGRNVRLVRFLNKTTTLSPRMTLL